MSIISSADRTTSALTATKPAADEFAPTHCHYDRETKPQPAYLRLDQDGEVRFWVSGDIGPSIPMSIWHECDLWWPVPHTLSASDCSDLIDEALPLLERIHAGREVEWDGSNMAGRYSEDAHAARADMERLCESIEGSLEEWDASEWVGDDAGVLDVTADMTDDALAARAKDLRTQAEGDGVILRGRVRTALERLRERLRDDSTEKAGEP